MAGQHTLCLFGDQTFDILPHLRDLLQHRDDPVLEDFLKKSYDAVRTEIFKLPYETREELPRFTCLEDLVLWSPSGKRCVAFDMAVTCIYQLGTFIWQADTWNYGEDRFRATGLCTGALAAAAVSSSSSTLNLVPLAVDAVVVAFRTGVLVADFANRVTTSNRSDQSWSIIVPGLKSLDAVHNFCEHTALPLSSRPYISSFAPHGITVSGPPTSLDQLTNSESFKGLGFKPIPIYGPYHAPHLYSQLDVSEILGGLAVDEGGEFKPALQDAVDQILLQPIRWSAILDELQNWLQNGSSESFRVVPIATAADQVIYTALRQTPLRHLVPSVQLPGRPTYHPGKSPLSPKKPKLAIIGMSGRFPGAKDNDAFWDLLYRGLDVHKPVPALHWDAKTHVDPTGSRKNTSATPFGCWLDDPALFDARFFNISPREAPQIDPAQRLALMTAYEAIEQAGIVPDATPSTRRDRVGVFYGVTSNDWMETNSAQAIDTYFIPGGNRAFIPGRINYFFKFSGPSYAVDTACSSSLAGIHLACNSLWQGDIDTAIAGGTNVLTNPDFTAGLDRGHFLSRTGNCKTFDDAADGYCRGEGVGTVIIKRLEDALADRDPILGVILGAYTNHSAESESITRPHVGAQRAIFSKILNQGAVDPYTVSYVEMHGTGTQAGDAGEMSSVLDTFAPPLSRAKRGRTADEALYLGSAKANIGHGEAASGVSSVIKVLLMMQKNTIVPHCGIKTKINRKFPTDLEERNVHIALAPIPWERNADTSKLRRVFVNNFSAAGGNSALLIEDAPLEKESSSQKPDLRYPHLIAVSAKNAVSLQRNLTSMLAYLKQNPDVPLGQLSYTTTARRIHHPHRAMLAGSSAQDMCTQIEAAIANETGRTRPKSTPKVVFAFTGQGAQYAGMGKQLFENFSFFRNEMHRLDRLAQNLGFPSVLPLIQSEEQDIGVFAPIVVQLANVCMQIALSKLWASWNITPDMVVGHSLGEYAALNVAGVLSETDALYLVGTRAGVLQETCTRDTHAMLVVKGSVDEIRAVLKDRKYEIACMNSPVETVLGGPVGEIAMLKERLADAGMKSTLLKVPYAFHSSQMDPMLSDYKRLAGEVTFSDAKIPVICPLDGQIVVGNYSGRFGPDYLATHSRQPVNMIEALLAAQSDHLITDQTTVLEIGPHPAISGMVRSVLGPQVACLASAQRARPVWQVLAATMKALYTAGADIRWAAYHRDFTSSHKVLPLPAYGWDLKEYWMQYVHDWSLRKGDPPLVVSNALRLESTTIHRVVEEVVDSQRGRIVVEADIARKDLSPLVQGHEVDGVPLCTPSVYADIALTLGTYLLRRYRPEQEECLVDVSDMTIAKALILRAGATQQLLQAHAEVDWASQSAAVKFASFDNKQKLQEHACCVVRFKDRSLQARLQNELANVKRKLQALRDGIVTGATARFNRPMVYRAIRPLARFHDDYRAIDEIVLNSATLEASSRLSFDSVKRGGDFHTHPAIIDSLTQSCGFTMNCNDSTDLDVEVFMNHGWGSFQIFEALNFDKVYTTYARMEEGKDKLWHGDVVIMHEETVVAHFGQIAIQGVPRRVLKVILSIESGNMSQKQQPARNKRPSPTSALRGTPQIVPPSTGGSHSSELAKALSIIAEESGLAVSDLTDTTAFADVGIDSLMGLTISARFREELDRAVDFDVFLEYPTVVDLKGLFGESDVAGASSPGTGRDSGDSSTTGTQASSATGITTPEEQDLAYKVDFQRALEIVSEESGVAMADLTDDTHFADSGVDSLLSLVIVSRFRDELGLDIQHESLFLECPTVADLKHLLLGDETDAADGTSPVQPVLKSEPLQIPTSVPDNMVAREDHAERIPAPHASPQAAETGEEAAAAALVARKAAVDAYVEKYTADFAAAFPTATAPPSLTLPPYDRDAKVVLVTGATGSLGSNLVYYLAQLPDVKTVICLNREKTKADGKPFARQLKAMREKGIRFPEHLKPKLRVFQTDAAAPLLGLSRADYNALAGSVTHLIHNAWPMSAKRPLAGFEPQFATMRNLLDLASAAATRRPPEFKFSFQLVSSIGVVGHYGLRSGSSGSSGSAGRVVVPEERATIDAVLPNGYSDAKWGCERMLDATLHAPGEQHRDRFRAMAVRLGQIAGSATSGYWNPMEHFGFLVKSSQTLNALPDVDGHLYWTPVNQVAAVLVDLVLAEDDRDRHPIYHVDNPVGQPWREMNLVLADALGIPTENLIPFEEWVERVRRAPQRNNPAATLLEFLDGNYLRMSCGGLVLDTKKALEHSKTLATVGPVSEEVARKYIHIWREIGFLN